MSESSAKMASSAGSGGVGGGGVAVATPTDPVTAPREPVDPRKDFASRHRVKKLLETYTMTADRSLMGPDQASEDASRDLFHQKYYSNAYKLPPDVELSKTTSRDISPSEKLIHENSETMSMSRVDLEASKRLQMQMAAAAAMAAGLKGGGGAGAPSPPSQRRNQAGNGLVTLSRIDGNGYGGGSHGGGVGHGGLSGGSVVDAVAGTVAGSALPSANAVTAADFGHGLHGPSRSRSSSSDPRHLTGEMINQMNALRKKDSATMAASLADCHRQQLQMQAIYERALREKSYLKYNNHSKQSTITTSGAAAAALASASSAVAAAAASTGQSQAASTSSTEGPGKVVPPVFSARDRGQANLSETRLANRNIAAFDVGGEKRCCLPQILNSVLDQISLPAIHKACDELQIYCSTCTPEQLDVFKLAKIIPNTASSCGLITKSDAERLCSNLLENSPPVASMMGFHATASPFSFRVQHECFGKCRGIVLPEAYTAPTARCIECLECEGLFDPAKFVCHSHRNRENRTCHWGFDSVNWRAYLHLSDDYTDAEQDKLEKTVKDFKSRYTNSAPGGSNGSHPTAGSVAGATAAGTAANTAVSINHHKRKPEPYNGNRERSLEDKSPRHPYDGLAKKARSSFESQPQVFSGPAGGGDPYGLFLYQTMQAAAAMAGGGKGQVHPAALAALSNYQAIKDGKSVMASRPGFSPGMPPPRPSSSTGHNGSSGPPRGFEAKMISPHDSRSGYVKSSPLSETAESPSERLAHSIESSRVGGNGSGDGDLVSPRSHEGHVRRPSKASSLADDILAIRAALDGASASARERTLKTLERLTERLALAESERDMALDQLKKLQRRYESTEEELHKKRAELREALRNDAVGGGSNLPPSHAREIEFTSKKFSSALPKMDMKSPARVMEEKSCGESSRSTNSRSATPPVSASAMHAANQAASAASAASGNITSLAQDQAAESPSDSAAIKLTSHLRRRSGTPASSRSCKSKESEDLRERMMTMEAELRALRDELSNRSSLASNTSSQATLKDTKELDSLAESGLDGGGGGGGNTIAEAVDNKVKKEEGSSISEADGPSEAKKAKKEDASEVHKELDVDDNKNNNKTTT